MYFGCVCFRGELGFLNCDDICMCVVNKQFELLEFVSDSVYVDLQYDEISLTSTASLWCVCSDSGVYVVIVVCLLSCGCLRSVCEVVVVRYVDAVVAVTVMCALLFVLHVCEGVRVTFMLVWGWMWCGCDECRTCV